MLLLRRINRKRLNIFNIFTRENLFRIISFWVFNFLKKISYFSWFNLHKNVLDKQFFKFYSFKSFIWFNCRNTNFTTLKLLYIIICD